MTNIPQKIFIAGHKGMVGSAIIRHLKKKNVEIIIKNKNELNLLNQQEVQNFFQSQKIDHVYLAAAKVGGIHANNTYPAEFIYENIMIQSNVIHSAFSNGVKKLLFLGSSCIYPKHAKQPMIEELLLTGKLEPTNEPYAIAKISGIKMCESYNRQFGNSHGIDYRCIMPTNLYGPGDNYHPENSHVIPGLIYRFHEAKKKNLKFVKIWGSGKVKREFLYVDDMAKACIHIMNLNKSYLYKYINDRSIHINVGSKEEITIKNLAKTIKEIVSYKGEIVFDSKMPDGTPRKLLSSKKINSLKWKPSISLEQGLAKTYKNYKMTLSKI